MTAREVIVESFRSWEYDEVTDVSEGSRSLQQLPYSAHERNESLVSIHSPRKTGDLLEGNNLITLQETYDKKFVISSVAACALKQINMAATEEDNFDPGLQETGGGATRSAFLEGNMEPPSTSGGDSGNNSGGLQRGAGDGGGMDGSLENKDDDFRPGPSHAPPPPHLAPTSPLHQDHPRYHMGGSQGDETDEDGMGKTDDLGELGGMGGPGQPMPLAHPAGMHGDEDEDDDDEEDDDDDDDDGHAPAPEGAYDPADYEHLSVSPEIAELFSYITRYTPQAIELEHRLRPYIPDYIPAVGDIDAFIKIPPPDGKPSLVGLEVLDEPSAHQSDATVLDLQLRALAKHTTAKSLSVKTVENAEKNGKVIEKWVRDISELHRTKPPPTVHYSKRMPDIDSLMQEWPGEVEELLKEINVPTAALHVELSTYVDIICAALDIPVYKSRIQSLHVLFTLYSVFKNSAHFRQLAEDNYIENDDSTADRLVIP